VASSHDGLARSSTSESDLRIFELDRPEFQEAAAQEFVTSVAIFGATLF
jgi:hypothetical protein